VLIEGLEVGPALKRAHRVLGSCRVVLFAGFLRWVACPLAMMLLSGVTACTAADPRSAATPTGSTHLGHGLAASPRSSDTLQPKAARKARRNRDRIMSWS
jgi:hypothetical protein